MSGRLPARWEPAGTASRLWQMHNTEKQTQGMTYMNFRHRASGLLSNKFMSGTIEIMLVLLLASLFGSSMTAQSAQLKQRPVAATHTDSLVSPVPARLAPIARSVSNGRQAKMLLRLWGIEDVHVRVVASGSLVRFSYRVVDPAKAKILNEKKSNPYMIVSKTGARIGVPTEENVGQLRQTAEPESGREYWMAFNNPGRAIQPGERVNVVIGAFQSEEMTVEASASVRP